MGWDFFFVYSHNFHTRRNITIIANNTTTHTYVNISINIAVCSNATCRIYNNCTIMHDI